MGIHPPEEVFHDCILSSSVAAWGYGRRFWKPRRGVGAGEGGGGGAFHGYDTRSTVPSTNLQLSNMPLAMFSGDVPSFRKFFACVDAAAVLPVHVTWSAWNSESKEHRARTQSALWFKRGSGLEGGILGLCIGIS